MAAVRELVDPHACSPAGAERAEAGGHQTIMEVVYRRVESSVPRQAPVVIHEGHNLERSIRIESSGRGAIGSLR
jgi:hypothetical protein